LKTGRLDKGLETALGTERSSFVFFSLEAVFCRNNRCRIEIVNNNALFCFMVVESSASESSTASKRRFIPLPKNGLRVRRVVRSDQPPAPISSQMTAR
jgi:hypothetical protein